MVLQLSCFSFQPLPVGTIIETVRLVTIIFDWSFQKLRGLKLFEVMFFCIFLCYWNWLCVGLSPFRVVVTTRIFTFLVGDLYINLYLPLLLGTRPTQIIWSNYSDLTRPHPKWCFSKGHLLFQGSLGWWNNNLTRNYVTCIRHGLLAAPFFWCEHRDCRMTHPCKTAFRDVVMCIWEHIVDVFRIVIPCIWSSSTV